MRKWIKRLIFTTPILFCSILCEDLNGYITSFHIKKLTEENISIKSSSLSDIVILEPGFSAEIEKTKGPSFAKLIVAIDDIKISIKKEDGTLTRNWEHLDETSGTRQFHDEKEWERYEENKTCKYTFNILPEDLIPLEDIIENQLSHE